MSRSQKVETKSTSSLGAPVVEENFLPGNGTAWQKRVRFDGSADMPVYGGTSAPVLSEPPVGAPAGMMFILNAGDGGDEFFITGSNGTYYRLPDFTPITFLTDDSGAFLTDDDGNFLVEDFTTVTPQIPIVTTLPTTLATGQQVIYRDPNGVQSLWIGNADGEAWPSVGYKEYSATLTQSDTNAPVATVKIDTIGITPVYARTSQGVYTATFSGLSNEAILASGRMDVGVLEDVMYNVYTISNGLVQISTVSESALEDSRLDGEFLMSIRLYP
jgi:hypothetical protein